MKPERHVAQRERRLALVATAAQAEPAPAGVARREADDFQPCEVGRRRARRSCGCDTGLADLRRIEAGDAVRLRYLLAGRPLSQTAIGVVPAAWRERAAGGRISGRDGDARDASRPRGARLRAWDRDEKSLRVGVPRVAEDGAHRPALDDAPAVHDRDLRREVGDDAQVVRDVDERQAESPPEAVDDLEDACLRGHVESRRRLVEDDEIRLADDGHGNADALLLPAAELVRKACQELIIDR